MRDDPTAISCELSPEALADRRVSWETVDVAVEARTRTAQGFTIRYRNLTGIEDAVNRLAAAERECCGWATWDVEPSGDSVLLKVAGPPEQLAPLASAFGA